LPTVEYRKNAVSLLLQRDQLATEILLHSHAAFPSPLIKKAGKLLARFWARADWKSREEILRTARWLVSVGATQSAMAAQKSGTGKSNRYSAGGNFPNSLRRKRRRQRSADIRDDG
jgi:hypothetical protein